MQEHLNDEYVKRAQKEGYRARAAYKLLEIDEKDKLIKPGMTVVDLGSRKPFLSFSSACSTSPASLPHAWLPSFGNWSQSLPHS